MNKGLDDGRLSSTLVNCLDIGDGVYDLSAETLRDAQSRRINLRPQSLQVLHQLALYEGKIVSKAHLIKTVWPDLTVTDDSVTQCIADIRRAIGDTDKSILKTVPKKGYKLQATRHEFAPPPRTFVNKASDGSKRWILAACLGGLALLGAGVMGVLQRTAPQDLRIAVLPFEDKSGDPRLSRLGRGLSIDIAEELARTPQIGVIGSESAFEAARMPAAEASDWLRAQYMLAGEIAAQGSDLSLTARLIDSEDQRLVWSETWTTPMTDYALMREEITHRASASLNGHFWFGALNRAVAEKAVTKPRRALSAYEEYLLGVSNILWSQADYEAALGHFKKAVAIDDSYARAWMMIGIMQLWIADVSPEDQRVKLQTDAYAALERAFLHAPNDGIIQTTMSVVHTGRDEVDAARRAILRGVELAPNNPDVLASAAWNAITADMEGPEPLEWARRAIDLNPKGPPWHRIGEGIAAFLAEDYLSAIKAMEAAPPHHKKYLFLAASHIELGNLDRASEAAQTLKANFPDYSLSGDYDVPPNAALDRLFSAAEAAGVTR